MAYHVTGQTGTSVPHIIYVIKTIAISVINATQVHVCMKSSMQEKGSDSHKKILKILNV